MPQPFIVQLHNQVRILLSLKIKKKNMNASDWIGTIGVTLILIAYFCSTFNWMSAHSKIFFLLNAVGSAMTCYASNLISYWPFVVLEGTWSVVSFVGFFKAKRWGGKDSVATVSH